MLARAVVVPLLLLAAASIASAQGPARIPVPTDSTALPGIIAAPDAQPGSVVSVAVRVPAQAGSEEAEYQVRPGTKVMLYGLSSGQLEWDGDEAILPLTFSVPRTEAAGVMHIAQVVVRWADGNEWIVDVQSRVGVRRGLDLALDVNSVLIERGGGATMRYTLTNRGNAADTIAFTFQTPARWELTGADTLAIAPGVTRSGVLHVRAPGDAFLGETQILAVTANGLGSASTASAAFEVASQTAADATWVRLPATLVVGLADAGQLQNGPLSFGLEASGPLGYGLEGSIHARRTGSASTAPAFHRYLAGPVFRARIERDGDLMTAGDVVLGGSPLLGHYMQGTGLDTEATLGSVRTSFFAARPYALDTPAREGHLVRAQGEVFIGSGIATAMIADLDRPYGIGGNTERTQLATGSYELGAGGHSGSVEAGLMRLQDAEGRERSGAVLNADYRYHDERLDVNARVRRVPASVATGGSAVDQSFISAAAQLGQGMSANAWAIRDDVALLDGSETRRDGAALSLRWREGLAAAQVTANVSQNEGGGLISGNGQRSTLSLGGTLPVGPLMLDGNLEVGRARANIYDEPIRNAAARVSFQQGPAWLWLGTNYVSGNLGADMQRIDLGGAVRTRRFEIDGGAGTYLRGGSALDNLNAWTSTTVHLDESSSVVVGFDYQPWSSTGSGLRLSLGARHAFGLPLPIKRHAVVQGTLYDDRNGNLRRDEGEPPIAGVVLRRGAMYTTSDPAGRFAFYDDALVSGDMRIDAASLEQGVLIPPGVRLPPAGRVDVPLHHAGALRLALFNDADNDGVRGATEGKAARATVEIVDEHDRTRTAAADENGVIEFRALSPGRYLIRAFSPQPERTAPARTVTVDLDPAGELSVDVPVPFKAVEIRFKSGT